MSKRDMTDLTKEQEEKIKEEISPVDADEQYKQMIDECYSFSRVGGPFEYMSPAKVLEDMDPTAYRCGFNDWTDSEIANGRLVQIGEDYFDADEAEEVLDAMDDAKQEA